MELIFGACLLLVCLALCSALAVEHLRAKADAEKVDRLNIIAIYAGTTTAALIEELQKKYCGNVGFLPARNGENE